jgi:hypothetical protein
VRQNSRKRVNFVSKLIKSAAKIKKKKTFGRFEKQSGFPIWSTQAEANSTTQSSKAKGTANVNDIHTIVK